jgi:hypothetical protein
MLLHLTTPAVLLALGLCVLLILRSFLFGSLLIPPTVKRVEADDPGFYMSGVFG